MDEWPPFVVETSAAELRTGRGWKDVVFELEDAAVEIDDDQTTLREGP